jgi:hypothetical protein
MDIIDIETGECSQDWMPQSCCAHCQTTSNPSKLNKAYLKKLDRKFDRLFKSSKFSTGRLTNTSKSVYSFEGEVLSEMDDEYASESSFEAKAPKNEIDEEEDDMVSFKSPVFHEQCDYMNFDQPKNEYIFDKIEDEFENFEETFN